MQDNDVLRRGDAAAAENAKNNVEPLASFKFVDRAWLGYLLGVMGVILFVAYIALVGDASEASAFILVVFIGGLTAVLNKRVKSMRVIAIYDNYLEFMQNLVTKPMRICYGDIASVDMNRKSMAVIKLLRVDGSSYSFIVRFSFIRKDERGAARQALFAKINEYGKIQAQNTSPAQ